MHIRKYTVSLMECVLFFIIEKSINSMLTHCIIRWCFAYSTFSNYFAVCVCWNFIHYCFAKFYKHTKTHESEQELTKFMYRGEIVVRYKTIQNFNHTRQHRPISVCHANALRWGCAFVGVLYMGRSWFAGGDPLLAVRVCLNVVLLGR